MEFARDHRRPHLHLCAADTNIAESLKAFVKEHDVKVLNVAGPASEHRAKGWSVCNGAVRRGSWYAGLTASKEPQSGTVATSRDVSTLSELTNLTSPAKELVLFSRSIPAAVAAYAGSASTSLSFRGS
jgi:hypothetical protein